MSRLRRTGLSHRFFFVTGGLLHGHCPVGEPEFEFPAGVIGSRHEAQGFLVAAWVFLPDYWRAILFPHYPGTISGVMESIKVSSTRQINRERRESGRLWQGRFFDCALRTVKEYNERVEYLHWNPVRAGLASRAEEWKWSSTRDYTGSAAAPEIVRGILPVDRILLPADERTRI
ncbi:MAG: REP-associated tyrosine transposase [Terriglobia bacterium]